MSQAFRRAAFQPAQGIHGADRWSMDFCPGVRIWPLRFPEQQGVGPGFVWFRLPTVVQVEPG